MRRRLEVLSGILSAVLFVHASLNNVAPLQAAEATDSSDRRSVVFDIRAYGAVADGVTNSAEAVNRAIDACSQAGGGEVLVPPGRFVVGAIRLQSRVHLRLSSGAVLLGSQRFEDYPLVEGLWGGDPVQHYSSLINANGATDIAITGQGVIDARGKVWWDAHLQGSLKHPPGRLIGLYRCKNVLVEGVQLRNSPAWTIHPAYCENVTISRVTIVNPYRNAPTTDGIDIDSSRNVHVSGCNIAVGDDCIVVKAGKGEYGRRIGIASENITISDCITGHGHGGVVLGSETAGGIRNVVVSNCVFDGTDSGIRMKTCRGRGGIVENIRVSNVVMRNIGQVAIKLDMKYEDTAPEPASDNTPTFRNIHLANITIDNAVQAAYLVGLPEKPIEQFSLVDVDFRTQTGIHCVDAKGIRLRDIRAVVQAGSVIRCSTTSDLDVRDLRSVTPLLESPVVELHDVRGARFSACEAARRTGMFARLSGAGTSDILLSGNLFPDGCEGVSSDNQVPHGAAICK